MTSNPRVLWLTPDKPDNISVGRQRIADHLEDEGFDVTVRGTTIATTVQSLREYKAYDAVIGTTRAGAFAGTVLMLFHRSPLLIDHIDPIRQFEETNPRWLATLVRLFENLSFALSKHVLFVYNEELNRVARYADSFSETDLGVEVERFENPNPGDILTVQNQFNEWGVEENVAIYVGGLEPIYHIKELLSAMSQLPRWSLVVIGDGSLRRTVANAAAERENIHYAGPIPHDKIPGYLHSADVGISLVDDLHTLKVLEYGLAGLSVVQLTGHAESRFGDMVEYTDLEPHHIAETICHAGQREPTNDLQSFATGFDWRDIADDYAEAIINAI